MRQSFLKEIMYQRNNIFAKILRGEIPCDVVYEDEKVLFFYDINPQAKIHILGIPKMEVFNFVDFVSQADKEMINHFFTKTNDIIREKKNRKKWF